MKIAKVSNYDNENYNEEFVENIPYPLGNTYAQILAHVLNSFLTQPHEDYYRVVPDDYSLQKREC